MNTRFTVVETSLNRAEFRWKWLKLVQYSSVLGAVLALLILLFGGALLSGWVTSKTLASFFYWAVGVGGFIAWALILITVMAGVPERNDLASAVERADRRLLDRLNTLIFLERQAPESRLQTFAPRIARQTQNVLAGKPSPPAFSASWPLPYLVALAVALTATVLLYRIYSPWQVLLAAQKVKIAQPGVPDKPLELALPQTNNIEQDQRWGEVRISDPGTDLKVTKVDVVPLQIEAAANQPLQGVNWYSAINGAEEQPHELPPPKEPRFAVYQPTIYLDELQLSDWDVMTYYAKASTAKKDSYASDVFFLEVRPFREDILKMPGGQGGRAYQTLSGLSSLISRQQHVIRQTHQHLQNPPPQETLKAQDRGKLSDAEADLGQSVEHLYAGMAAEMENKPIGDVLDNLAKAGQSLGQASKLLHDNVMDDAQNRERSALSELIAARKTFQKAVSENPGSFQDATGEDEPPPTVADASKKLNQMAEFRNESKAAQDFVRKTLDEQKKLEDQARSGRRADYPGLGRQEEQLRRSMEDFQDQHPQVFNSTQQESRQAGEAMSKAASSLQQRSSTAPGAAQDATRQLQKLSDSMQSQAAQQQLADAYKLKQMLDQEAQKFDQMSRPDSQATDADQQRTATEARQTVEQLKNTAEQEPTRNAFGQPLRDALDGPNKADLDNKLDRAGRTRRLAQARDGASKQQSLADARDALKNVSKAFDASQPQSLQAARQNDALKPSEQDSFAQGMAELDSLVKQMENDRQIPPGDQAKQGQQALADLQTGMRGPRADNETGDQLLHNLQQMLKGQSQPNLADLKQLLEQLQHFSAETSEKLAKQDEKPQLTNIDPARLPPAYRGRIQTYFEKLSER